MPHIAQEVRCSRCITGLARCEGEVCRASLGIDERMDLRRQPAPGASHAAMVPIPLFAAAPC